MRGAPGAAPLGGGGPQNGRQAGWFTCGASTRQPVKIVAHLADLMAWGVTIADGDTVVFDGLAARLRPYAVDVALLPINGKVGNMSGTDAARLISRLMLVMGAAPIYRVVSQRDGQPVVRPPGDATDASRPAPS